MHVTSAPALALALGQPRFSEPQADALAASGDAVSAWRRATADRPLDRVLADIAGSFAIGIAEPGRTWIAVDRFAVQSMCYRIVDGELRFAARADELADAHDPIDPQAIFDYLYFHVIPSPRTIHAGVRRLPPGHVAVFENGRLDVRPYWVPEFREDHSVPLPALKDRFLALVSAAVAAQRDPVRPACFLSGGTDSSTVAGMLSRLDGPKPSTYSIGFDAQGYDEMEYARLAAKHFGCDHHEYYVTPDDLVQGIPALAASLDQPFGNSSCLPAWCCARMAREDGVTRLLAGDGGDELFGGNARYAKQRVFGWYERVPGFVRRGLIEPLVGIESLRSIALLRKADSYVEQARAPMPDRLQLYNLVMRLGPETVLSDAMLARVDPAASLALQREAWRQPGECSALNRELAYDWRFTLAESDLPKVHAACRLAGVDVAFPMLDDALLAFSLTLPTDHKLKRLQLRWFFKEALRGFLPDAIIEKKKHGFGLPFGVWTNRTPALMALAKDSLSTLAERGVVRPAFVQDLLARRLAEHPGYYGEMVWILMMLEQWLRAKSPRYRAA
jgi:asparagine synthase (glutamine-hydrolysing)